MTLAVPLRPPATDAPGLPPAGTQVSQDRGTLVS
jgi:hypothetical protein